MPAAQNRFVIRSENLKALFKLIVHSEEGISRAQLAKEMRLSKSTISDMVEELMGQGYLLESVKAAGRGLGRRPQMLTVNSVSDRVLVISWQQKLIAAASVASSLKVAARAELAVEEGCDYVTESMKLLKMEGMLDNEGQRVIGICIIVPSIIDDQQQRIISTVISAQAGQDMINSIRHTFAAWPVAVLNDSACYAYDEYLRLEKLDDDFVFINMSKGIGAVSMHRDEILRGANGMAMQFGHMSIDPEGPVCRCGGRGCLERMAGEINLPELAVKHGLPDEILKKSNVKYRDIGLLMRQGHMGAAALIDDIASSLSFGLSTLISLLHPRTVVLGGYAKHLGERFLESIRLGMSKTGFPPFVRQTALRFSLGDEDSSIIGAAAYFIDKHLSFERDLAGELFLS